MLFESVQPFTRGVLFDDNGIVAAPNNGWSLDIVIDPPQSLYYLLLHKRQLNPTVITMRYARIPSGARGVPRTCGVAVVRL